MGGGRLLFNQTLHTLFGRPVEQRFGSAPRAILKDARRGSLPGHQTLHERIDGGCGAVEDPGDLGGREAVSKASRAMCIRNLLEGLVSRFIFWMRSLRC